MARKEGLSKANAAKWDSISTKILLHICMYKNSKSGKSGIAYRKKKWEEIHEEFNKRANKNYTQKKLKNRLYNLRINWTMWKQLMGKERNLGWNNETRTIEVDSAWWDAKIRENRKYAKFRYQELEFRDELDFIFGNAVTTSENVRTPTIGLPTGSSGENVASDLPQEIVESDDEEFDLDEEVGIATTMIKTLERLVQAAENLNKANKDEITAISHVRGQYSIPNCIEVLNSLEEKGLLNSQQFNYALELLKDNQNRVILISLKDSTDALVNWILYKYE